MKYERVALLQKALIGAGLCLASIGAPSARGQTEDPSAYPTPPTSLPVLVDPADGLQPVPTPMSDTIPVNPPPEPAASPAENAVQVPVVTGTESVLTPEPLNFESLTDLASRFGQPHPAFEIWKFRVGLGVHVDLTTDDNIFLQKRNGQSGTFLRFAPTISLASSGRLASSLVYTPTIGIVIDGPVKDTLDQDLAIRLQTGTEKTTIGYQLNYQHRSGSNVEFSGRVDSDYLANRATVRYQMTEKTAAHIEASYELRSFNGGNDSSNEAIEPYLSYRIREKWFLDTGARFSLGQNTDSPDQTTQSPTLRLRYIATERWSFSAGGGYEFRQVKNGRKFTSPAFSVSTRFEPRSGSVVSFDASRQTRVSDAFANQLIEGYYLRLQFRQRFLTKFHLVLGGGYSNEEFTNSNNVFILPHTDEYFYFQPQLEIPVGGQQNVVLYYMRRELTSTLQSSGFENNQFGLLWSFTF